MKFAASTTLKRTGAAAAVVAALLTTSGCGFINTFDNKQPTTIVYDASDGVSFSINDKDKRFEVRNVMLISEGDGAPGRLLGTVLNLSDTDLTLEIDWATSGSKTTRIEVPAKSQIRFEDDANKVILPSVDKLPGETLIDAKATIGSTTEKFNLPILNGAIEEYKEYIPNASDTSTEPGDFKSFGTNPGATPGATSPSATPSS